MPDRPVIQRSSEPSSPIVRAGLAKAHPPAVGVDRRKRIDDYIDYFGNGALSSQPAARHLRRRGPIPRLPFAGVRPRSNSSLAAGPLESG